MAETVRGSIEALVGAVRVVTGPDGGLRGVRRVRGEGDVACTSSGAKQGQRIEIWSINAGNVTALKHA